MVRKFHKKKSKRTSTRLRTKVEKKVTAHHRKARREKKKNPEGATKRTQKIHIPNSFPFKDEVLKDAEDAKRRLEEERERQKERRKMQRDEMRNQKRNLGSLVADAQKRGDDFEQRSDFVDKYSKEYTSGKATESSLKQYYKEFRKVVEASDVVLQVLDARDPLGSRCPQVEEAVLGAGHNKRLVLLLNKVDLVPKENVESWLKYLRNEFPTIAFKASTQSQNDNLSRSKVPLNLASDDLRKSSRCLGAELLLKLLGNYCRNKDIRTSITVGIVGFPNTGKSSIINSLKRSKACSVGATPGVTRAMQRVHLDKHIMLLDSPGVVMATGATDATTILRNCVRVETLEDPVTPAEAVLKRCTKEKLMAQYGVGDFNNVHEFLALLALKQGKLRKGGLPDSNKAARTVIGDWNQGRITYYTHPPESATTHVSADIVTEMSKEFDIDSLLTEESDTLIGVGKQASTGDVVLAPSGPTQAAGDDNMGEDSSGEDEDSWEDASDDMEEEEDEEDGDMEAEDADLSKKAKHTQEPQFTVAVASTSKPKKPDMSKRRIQRMSARELRQQEDEQELSKVTPGLLSSDRDRKKHLKKLQKKREKADAVAGELSSALEGAFGALGGAKDSGDSDYDFDKDYK